MGSEYVWTCNFCGLTNKQVAVLFSGPRNFICDQCVDVAAEHIDGVTLRTLATNLAVAGGLCAAFWEGWEQREHHDLYSKHGYRTDQDWRPGCALTTRQPPEGEG